MLGRPFRLALALTGTLLWLLYPVMLWRGIAVRWMARCGDKPFTGEMDACHNDYLPVLEVAWSAVAWILTIAFLRFALTVFRGDLPPKGIWRWSGDAIAVSPVYQVLAIIGAAWAAWNWLSLPFQLYALGPLSYWAIFGAWFALAVGVMRSDAAIRVAA